MITYGIWKYFLSKKGLKELNLKQYENGEFQSVESKHWLWSKDNLAKNNTDPQAAIEPVFSVLEINKDDHQHQKLQINHRRI